MDYFFLTAIFNIGLLFCTAQNWAPEGVKEVKWFATHLCKDSKGHNGTCMSLQTCYADTRFPNLSGWSEFISGDYDACAYIKQPAGIPFVGACCTKSSVTVATTILTTITTPSTTTSETSPTTPAWPMAPAIPDWPPTHPPLPTHPPSLTQPPLPTHPPFLGFPWPWFTQTPVRMKPTSTTPGTIILPWLKPKTTTSTITSTTTTTTTPPTTTSMATPSPIIPQCGKQGDAFRVVGGQEAGYWPWMTGLIGRRGLFCGGSLVSNYHILTAAHCVYGLSPTDLTVRLGDRDLSTTSDYAHIDVKVSSITIHPSYNTRTNHQDVAILRLASKVTFNKYIQPVCLPDNAERSYANQNAIVIGWGATRARGPTSKILMQLTMRVWSVEECQTRFMKTFPGQIVPSNVCAGDGGKDACSGDSGGPLMKVDNGIYTQIGIVSWGVGCGTYNYPGVYTRVTSYLSWIKSNLV